MSAKKRTRTHRWRPRCLATEVRHSSEQTFSSGPTALPQTLQWRWGSGFMAPGGFRPGKRSLEVPPEPGG